MQIKRISVIAERSLYSRVSAAAKASRMSRSAWAAVACEEKLARLEAERHAQAQGQPARPAGDGEDAA